MIVELGILGAVGGALCVGFERPLLANKIWLFSNPLLMVHNYKVGEYEQSLMFLIYCVIAIFGIVYHYRRHSYE